MTTPAPTIGAMEQAGWSFVYGHSAYKVCVCSPDGVHIATEDIQRAYAPSPAQRAEWLEDANAAAEEPAGKGGAR